MIVKTGRKYILENGFKIIETEASIDEEFEAGISYYEKSSNSYIITPDTTPVSGKTYYNITFSGFELKAKYGNYTRPVDPNLSLNDINNPQDLDLIECTFNEDNLEYIFKFKSNIDSNMELATILALYYTTDTTPSQDILIAATTYPQYTISGTNQAIFTYYLYF